MLERFSEQQLKDLKTSLGITQVTTSSHSLCTCCGTILWVNGLYRPTEGRINYKFQNPTEDLTIIPANWESLVIPDATGNLTLIWKAPTTLEMLNDLPHVL